VKEYTACNDSLCNTLLGYDTSMTAVLDSCPNLRSF
jgi:hypothetical protein